MSDSNAQSSQRWAGVTTQEAFDELRSRTSAPAAPLTAPSAAWHTFFDALGGYGTAVVDELAARVARVQRRVREDGATYNVHAPEGGASREWPLQLLPFIIDADEWAAIERGELEARLAHRALRDLRDDEDVAHRMSPVRRAPRGARAP